MIHVRKASSWLAPALALALFGACMPDQPDYPVPTAEEIEPHYVWEGPVEVEMSGNVAQVSVTVDPGDFARGGDLWAKAFPYIFIFSPGTQAAFEENPGLGGVRVLIHHPNGDVVSQALLSREVLTELTWNRALNISREAREDGTERPARMQDLVRWGEDHTEFEYNPNYIDNP